jgi:hypothetical protein
VSSQGSLDGRRIAALGWRSAATRLLAIVVAAATLAAALLFMTEVALAQLQRDGLFVERDMWVERLRSTSWGDASVVVAAGIVSAVGALLVVGAGWRRRPEAMTVCREGVHVVAVRRGDLERSVAASVADDTGLEVTTELGRRRARIRLRSELGPAFDRAAVTATAARSLAAFGLSDVKVKVLT